MKKKLIALLIVLFLIVSAIISTKFEKAKLEKLDITKNAQKIVENAQLIDINTDHNQVLDVAEYMKANKIKMPSTLVNFDTHSDLVINMDILTFKESNVENWINIIVAKYPEIKEIYWVMPYEEAKSRSLQIAFAENDLEYLLDPQVLYGNSTNPKIKLSHFIFTPLTKKAFEQELLVDTTNGRTHENTTDENIQKIFGKDKSKLKKVKLITCTENTLPNLKDKDILLSIDADYIGNSGFDTIGGFNFIKDNINVNAVFYSIFKTLTMKNANPRVVTLSLSPQYLPIENHEYVKHIFEYILDISNKEDKITNYKNEFIDHELYMLKYQKADN